MIGEKNLYYGIWIESNKLHQLQYITFLKCTSSLLQVVKTVFMEKNVTIHVLITVRTKPVTFRMELVFLAPLVGVDQHAVQVL